MTLIELSKEGFSSLLGVDYSDSAIRLATTVAEEHSYDVKYEVNITLMTYIRGKQESYVTDCGKSMTLIELSKEGFSSLLGVDY